jgi:hypothetical protein
MRATDIDYVYVHVAILNAFKDVEIMVHQADGLSRFPMPHQKSLFLVTTELPPCQYSTAPKRKGRAGLPRSRVVNCRNELFFNLPTSDNLKPFEEHT